MAKGDQVAIYNANGRNGIDVSEVSSLVLSLKTAPYAVAKKSVAVVKKGAVNIKKEAREIIAQARSAKTSLPAYPYSISFGLSSDGLSADIGPARRGNKNQAKIGNLLEYGGAFNAPIPHLQPALEHEAPRFRQQLAYNAGDIL